MLSPLITSRDDYPTNEVTVSDISKRFVNFLSILYPASGTKSFIDVVCAFDQAHTLVGKDKTEGLDVFPAFRRAIRQLHEGIFILCVSSNAESSPVEPGTNELSPSCCNPVPEFSAPRPFTDLPVDLRVNPAYRGGFSLDDAVKIEYMVQFGRPM